ncbi:MAG: iron-sulfur cluster assembly scaffold protein [Patescibacteria group bacterium]
MALNYTKKTMKHFLEPQNVGEIKKPDGYAQIGNMVCGDQLDFFLKVEKGRIKDVKFLSFGCASNIATASMLTEKVKGMKIEEAKKYKWEKVVSDLGGLPHQKEHCSVMAVQGLKKAIADYEKNQVIEPSFGKKPIKKLAKIAVKKVTLKKLVKKPVIKKSK